MPHLPITEARRKQIAEKRAADELVAARATLDKPVPRRGIGRGSALRNRINAQAIVDAAVPQDKVVPSTAPALLQQDTVSLADLGVKAPRVAIEDAFTANDRDVASAAAAREKKQQAADKAQVAELRRSLASFDISDIEERRAYLTGLSPSGRLSNLARDRLNKEAAKRRSGAVSALQAIDTNARGVASNKRLGRGMDESIRMSSLNRLTDIDKKFLDIQEAMADPTLSKDGAAALAANLRYLGTLRAQEEQGVEVDSSLLSPSIGFGFADGGEILPPDEVGVAPPELPPAVSEAPLPLDSGDYIVPIEAMRFYGRKFFQDLINKAEDVE